MVLISWGWNWNRVFGDTIGLLGWGSILGVGVTIFGCISGVAVHWSLGMDWFIPNNYQTIKRHWLYGLCI